MVNNQRVGSLHQFITGNRFRGRYGNIGTVRPGSRPYTFIPQCIRKTNIVQGFFRKRNFHMGKHRFILLRCIFPGNSDHFFRCILPRSGIHVSGNHSGSIITCISSHQQRCTRHLISPLIIFYFSLICTNIIVNKLIIFCFIYISRLYTLKILIPLSSFSP